MGEFVGFDEQLLRQIAAKNGMAFSDAQFAELAENGGFEIMAASEAGISEQHRSELLRRAEELGDD